MALITAEVLQTLAGLWERPASEGEVFNYRSELRRLIERTGADPVDAALYVMSRMAGETDVQFDDRDLALVLAGALQIAEERHAEVWAAGGLCPRCAKALGTCRCGAAAARKAVAGLRLPGLGE